MGRFDEDAWRRDFTLNALYYNIEDFSLVDYCGALEDITQGRIRMIGDPIKRYARRSCTLIKSYSISG